MNQKRISFIRHYHGYTGGHKKVRDYLSHFIELGWTPSLYLSNQARTNRTLFTSLPGVTYQTNYEPDHADVVFLAGMDWQTYLPTHQEQKPIVNLIQHVRHGDSKEPLFQYLQYPAIRLCVSEAVREAILPHANGPCHVIKMGHEFTQIKRRAIRDIYILATKQPQLGAELQQWAQREGLDVLCHTKTQESTTVVEAMASSDITVVLPHKTEGFYLPGIEAMRYSRTAIVPYCVANKEYYSRFSNMHMPHYTLPAIQASITQALNTSAIYRSSQGLIGRFLSRQYTIDNERKQLARCLSKYF